MTHSWRRVASRLGWDHNPLRRGVDRIEAATMSALLAIFLIGGPALAVVAGRLADSAGLREQRAEQSWYQRPATLLASAGMQLGDSTDLDTAWVLARWTARDGQQRTGLVATTLDARAGERVDVWLTADGRLTHPPLSAADVRDQVTFTVLSLLMGLALVLAVTAGLLQVMFSRRRMAGWQRDWDAVGPLWSRKQ